MRGEFLANGYKLAKWGVSSTPLVFGDRLIVNVCGEETTLVSLRRETLEPLWRATGKGSGYASCIAGQFGGREQVIGYQSDCFSGWDIESGELLWTIHPDFDGDFNVPTPLAVGENRLLVATENNAMRLHQFDERGILQPEAIAVNEEIMPSTVTPVAVGGYAYCTSGDHLFRVDLNDRLRTDWFLRDRTFQGHSSLIADRAGKRLLVVTYVGELLLFDIAGDEPKLLSRRWAFGEDADEEIYSHPAMVGNHLYVRGTQSLVCLAFPSPTE
jgi:hypothetical protein